jgi:hypothetical protein
MRVNPAVLTLLYACGLSAQTITGSIIGTAKDPSGLAVAGAHVVLTQTATAAKRESKTDARGEFVFTSLQPGEYSVSVGSSGFKTVEKRQIILSASEILSVGELILQVGAVSETVTVTAQGATVQTASAERAGSITSKQVEDLSVRSRSVMSLLQLLPGVVDLQNSDSLDKNFNIHAAGGRQNTNNVAMDGMSLNAIGNNNNTLVGISQDSVAEVKVLVSNYQAEYGRMSGANISLVTKSGTRDFHGLGSYFKRHEQFNANDFFNNRLGVPKPVYRFNTWTYNVGGPIYVPGKFNRNRDKLFFFWSQEFWPKKTTQAITQRTVPTELERTGDLSQSLDLNGKLIPIIDPTTRQAFPENRIPLSRIDVNGQALLKALPLPNFSDRTISGGRYNYVFQNVIASPMRTELLKLDYNINSRNMLFGNYTDYTDTSDTYRGMNWPQMMTKFTQPGKVLITRYTRVLNPTTVNELNFGYSHRPANDALLPDQLKRNQRDQVGFTLGQFFAANNPYSVIPNATFGGVTGAANLKFEGRFPLQSSHDTMSVSNNLTRTQGAHILRAGLYIDHIWRNATNAVQFNGSFDFGRNANSPLDTGYAYANALAGVFNSYTESSARPFLHYRLGNIEWFAQDNWKATRRLTLDLGLRFAYIPPVYEQDNLVSGFVPGRFDPGQQVSLIQPVTAGGKRSGVDPNTGQVYPAALIGAIAPGVGDPANGMVVSSIDKSYPRSLINNRGINFGPRIGFAFDPFGNGKTAIRAGFGIFYNRENLDGVLGPFPFQPPLVNTPVIYFGTLPTLLSSKGLLFPQDVVGIDRAGKIPTVMNFSLSVQRNIGAGVVIDTAYVGSLGRHLPWTRNLNAIPFGTNFNPANADPTNKGGPLPASFLRPVLGYGDINYREFASSSNYHSLQVSANRRFAKGVQFGASWTWSKSMDYSDSTTDAVSNLVPVRIWNYGLASFDRTHVVKVNWLWDVPKGPWSNKLVKAVINNWQISGITSFVSGEPLGVGFANVTATDITGSPTDGARIVVTANPNLPKSERTFDRNFRTEVFRAPAKGTIGNAAPTLIRGPGINNWDTAVYKNFPIRERMKVQFRWELYNLFNHTQFSGLDTTARFDAAGNQVNRQFGQFTASRDPRQMQFALRFYF